MLTQEQKTKYKAQLQEAEAHLQEELRDHRATVASEHPGYSSHMADDASDVYEQQKEQTWRQSMERDLEMVQAALHKLEHDTYGECERCGEPIDPARLDALPHVRFCVPCQTYMENRYP